MKELKQKIFDVLKDHYRNVGPETTDNALNDVIDVLKDTKIKVYAVNSFVTAADSWKVLHVKTDKKEAALRSCDYKDSDVTEHEINIF